MKTKACPPPLCLAQHHRGILIDLARKYWVQLPLHVKVSYDIEDMLSDVTLHVLRRSEKFNRSRGASSTFVWRVAENYCRVLLKRETWLKRRATEMVYLDAPLEDRSFHTSNVLLHREIPLTQHDSGYKLRESRKAVETMIKFASDELRDALSDLLLANRSECRKHLKQDTLSREVGKLARQHRITASDFRIVMHALI